MNQGPAHFHHLPNSKQAIRQHNKAEQKPADMKHFDTAKKSASHENDLLKLQAQQANKLEKEATKMALDAANK